jgi:hypothetical protein
MRRNCATWMTNLEKAIKRLAKPPSVANWTRHNFRRLDKTREGLLRFVRVPPKHSLGDVYMICSAIVADGISLQQAEACVDRVKHPLTREAAREIIPTFFAYAKEQQLEGLPAFKGFSAPYPIGRAADGSTLLVPVTPTFTLLDRGVLKPVFLIAWAKLALDDYQKRLLSTIIRNAILTQQDFLGSDATVVCMPRHRLSQARVVRAWSVSEYAQLSDDELQEQFMRYQAALAAVIRTLREG